MTVTMKRMARGSSFLLSCLIICLPTLYSFFGKHTTTTDLNIKTAVWGDCDDPLPIENLEVHQRGNQYIARWESPHSGLFTAELFRVVRGQVESTPLDTKEVLDRHVIFDRDYDITPEDGVQVCVRPNCGKIDPSRKDLQLRGGDGKCIVLDEIIMIRVRNTGSQLTINYALTTKNKVQIDIVSLTGGQVVQVLPPSERLAGKHEQVVNTENIQSGFYFVRCQIGQKMQTVKFVKVN